MAATSTHDQQHRVHQDSVQKTTGNTVPYLDLCKEVSQPGLSFCRNLELQVCLVLNHQDGP